MKPDNGQNFDSKFTERQNSDSQEKSFQSHQYYNQTQNSEGENNLIFQNTLKKLIKKLLNSLPILALIISFGIIWFEDFQTYDNKAERIAREKKIKAQHKQQVRKECYINDYWDDKVFFVSFDFQDMTKNDVQQFQKKNRLCNFQLKREISLMYFVDLWNQKEGEVRKDKYFINKTALSLEESRQLLIWLKLYYRAGIYIHTSLGLNFGKYLSDEYLLQKSASNEIIFAQYDNQKKRQGIQIPQKNFRTVKVENKLSEKVGDIIKKIILKQDWIELCKNNQCMVVKDGMVFQKEL